MCNILGGSWLKKTEIPDDRSCMQNFLLYIVDHDLTF